MTTQDRAREVLSELVQHIEEDDGVVTTHAECLRIMERALTASRKAPEGCVIDDTGTVRKVLGTLPITADGCVVMPGGFVWLMPPHCANPAGFGFRVLEIGDAGFINTKPRTETDARWSDCYSTRAAAEAAKGASDGHT